MADSGTILTITYGRFRCTLEDFEDPLQIMTAILDYLRYLEAIGHPIASGAPDPDILVAIAAGGTARQVAAEEGAGGIRLRPAVTTAPAGAPPDAGPAERCIETDRDDEMTRIFAETDMQLDTPASNWQRNAIQHARAALAATRMTGPEDFGSFVAGLGAGGLPDLVEAAAAYLTDIEGLDRIPPQRLTEKLEELGEVTAGDEVPRACAALLEAGKLRACPDGCYAITDRTGFRVPLPRPH